MSIPCLLVMFILIRCFFILKSCNDIICVGCEPEGDSQKIWNAGESFTKISNKKIVCEVFITSTQALIVSHQENHNNLKQHMLFCK